MIERLVAALGIGLDLTSEEIADVLWLTNYIDAPKGLSNDGEPELDDTGGEQDQKATPDATTDSSPSESPKTEEVDIPSEENEGHADLYSEDDTTSGDSLPFRVPDARSLREPLELARALRPLLRRVESGTSQVLDEEATIQRIADERVWIPVLKPSLEPWLDLVLVVDESPSMLIWQRTVLELKRIVEKYGVFRDVSTWSLSPDSTGCPQLHPGLGVSIQNKRRAHKPSELIDPSGRRLILVVSDCTFDFWYSGLMVPMLKSWAETGPMAITQMLPQWFWRRTALGNATSAQFLGLKPGEANKKLTAKPLSGKRLRDVDASVNIPVVTLEAENFSTWAAMLTGKGGIRASGVIYNATPAPNKRRGRSRNSSIQLSAEEQVQRFRLSASPMGRKLTGLLASAPIINLPIVRIIQDEILPESKQVHVAEVFLSGLLQQSTEITPNTKSSEVQFQFSAEIRDLLLESVPENKILNVVDVVSAFIAKNLQLSLEEFAAFIRNPESNENKAVAKTAEPFATVTAQILRRLGGRYAQYADELKPAAKKNAERENSQRKSGGNETLTPVRKRWAFLVGINDYQDKSFSSLRHCVNDVVALESFLNQVGYTVVSCHDNLPKRDSRFPRHGYIEAEMRKLNGQFSSNDLLLVYFVGHGTHREDGTPCLIAEDTRTAMLPETGIPVFDVEQWMRESGAGKLVLMLDSVHSGASTDRASAFSGLNYLESGQLTQAIDITFIMASTNPKKLKKRDEKPHGILNYHVLSGLAGEANVAGSDVVTVDSLIDYITREIRLDATNVDGSLVPAINRSESVIDIIGVDDIILVDHRVDAQEKQRLDTEGRLESLANVVSIWSAAGVVGTGFWVESDYLLTCKHVVDEALGSANKVEGEQVVEVVFSSLATGPRLRAKVVFYQKSEEQDIAVLKLIDRLSTSILDTNFSYPDLSSGYALQILRVSQESLTGKRFPVTYHGVIENGWIQLVSSGMDVSGDDSLSGAPVWDEISQSIVGMIVARSYRGENHVYMLSLNYLEKSLSTIQTLSLFDILNTDLDTILPIAQAALSTIGLANWIHPRPTTLQGVLEDLQEKPKNDSGYKPIYTFSAYLTLPKYQLSEESRQSIKQWLSPKISNYSELCDSLERNPQDSYHTELTSKQYKTLRDALLNAFLTKDDLDQIVERSTGMSLSDIIESSLTYNETIFKVIRWAKAKGYVRQLVIEASQLNSENPDLRTFVMQNPPILLEADRNNLDLENSQKEKNHAGLTGKQFSALADALLSAFPNIKSLKRMVRLSLQRQLNDISNASTLANIVYDLIEWAESQGKIKSLVIEASQRNPGNSKLQDFVRENILDLLVSEGSSQNVERPLLTSLLKIINSITDFPYTVFNASRRTLEDIDVSHPYLRTQLKSHETSPVLKWLIILDIFLNAYDYNSEGQLYILVFIENLATLSTGELNSDLNKWLGKFPSFSSSSTLLSEPTIYPDRPSDEVLKTLSAHFCILVEPLETVVDSYSVSGYIITRLGGEKRYTKIEVITLDPVDSQDSISPTTSTFSSMEEISDNFPEWLAEAHEIIGDRSLLIQRDYDLDFPPSSDLTVEFWLPFKNLNTSVDTWEIYGKPVRLRRKNRVLGKEYKLLVHSYDRFVDPETLNNLVRTWQKLNSLLPLQKKLLSPQENLPSPHEEIVEMRQSIKIITDNNNLSSAMDFSNTFILVSPLSPEEVDFEYLIAIIFDLGIPIFAWSRVKLNEKEKHELENLFIDALTRLPLHNGQRPSNYIAELVYQLRKNAQSEQDLGNHLAVICDDPQPILELRQFRQRGRLRV